MSDAVVLVALERAFFLTDGMQICPKLPNRLFRQFKKNKIFLVTSKYRSPKC